jgi:class 3 adenylate cyclase
MAEELPHAPAHLLVTDDNKVNRLLLTRNLELQGHTVRCAENGRMALEMLAQESFDLLLLDVEMPEMNGFEVLEALAGDHRLRDLPVIVTSSLEGVANIARCIELGAEDYLHKPVNPVLLKARINSSLEKKRLRDQQKEMVRRFATPEVAQDLAQSGFALGGRRVQSTVMFTDIRAFTAMVESQPPEETIELLNSYYTLMFDAINSQGGVVNQIIGDGLMAIFGAPQPLADHAAAAVRAALEMVEMIQLLNAERAASDKPPLRIGVGIATGETIAGYTGTQQRATYTCIGDTVNLAARLEAHTKQAKRTILIDAATCNELGGRIPVEALGTAQFRGKAAPVPVFAVPWCGAGKS